MGRLIVFSGLVIMALGVVVWLLEAAGVRPGALPGDIVWRRGNSAFYFPIVTSIVLSIVLTVLFYVFSGLRR